MKHLLAFLFVIFAFNRSLAQQNNPPPTIKPDKRIYNVVYSNNATYRFILDTKKISVLKPKTVYLKILTFESEKKATLETVFNVDEVKLIDNDLTKTTIKQEVKEIPLDVVINDNMITLSNAKLKTKIILKIDGYNELMLKNIKTGEIFFTDKEKTKSAITIPLNWSKKDTINSKSN